MLNDIVRFACKELHFKETKLAVNAVKFVYDGAYLFVLLKDEEVRRELPSCIVH